MGYMSHNAIIVTSWDEDALQEAHRKALELFESGESAGARGDSLDLGHRMVTAPTGMTTNLYRSFLIAPDGSKEGWVTSEHYNEMREAFKAHLREMLLRDKFTDWVEVQFGNDDNINKIVDAHDMGTQEQEGW